MIVVAARAFLIGAGAFGMFLAVPWAGASAGAPSQISLTTVPQRTTLVTRPRSTSVPVSSTKVTGTTRPGTPPTRSVASTLPVGATTLGPGVTRFTASTTTIPATTTTIQGINGRVPVVAATLPLHTAGTNGHVSPVFVWLSGIGLAVGLLIAGTRLIFTRSGGRDRSPLT
jgi:hypothetical protein